MAVGQHDCLKLRVVLLQHLAHNWRSSHTWVYNKPAAGFLINADVAVGAVRTGGETLDTQSAHAYES